MFSLNDKTRASALRLTSLICFFVATGCAGYQTFDDKISLAKQNLRNCQSNYRVDSQVKALGDLLLTDNITDQMTAISDLPGDSERQIIKKLRNSEATCRRNYAVAVAKAVDSDYPLRRSYSITQAVSVGLVEYVKGTDDALKNLHSGRTTFGEFYKALERSANKLKRTANIGSLMAAVESNISYQQRRDAADRAMANVRSGMQEHCIGCAFSRDNKEEASRNSASESWSGVFQGHEINGTNKICKYMKDGSPNYITVASYELCPVIGESNTSENNGVFTGSYLQGLNKACVYNQFGNKKIVTVGLAESCPR